MSKILGVQIDDEKYRQFRAEADSIYRHLSVRERDIAAMHLALTHTGLHGEATPDKEAEKHRPVDRLHTKLLIVIGVLLVILILAVLKGHAEPITALTYRSGNTAIRVTLPLFGAQGPGVIVPSLFKFDGSGNLVINCITGCSAVSGFVDNAAFTVGTTTINNIGAYFTSGADPACTTGNACRLRIDAASNLRVNCIVGCAGGSTTPSDAFANPTTAGLQFDLLAGWNGATWDRLQVDGSKFLKVNCSTGCSGGASTPTDAFANPTTASLNMGFNMGWNGTTWDRLKSTTANGLVVDVSRVQGTVAATQSGTWNDRMQDGAGNALASLGTQGDANAAATRGLWVSSFNYVQANSGVFDTLKEPINGQNNTGNGLMGAAMIGQFDDVTPNTCTENQFCNERISSKGVAYNQIRDAAGNERGANVSAGNALLVDGSATTQPVSGTITTIPPANASTNVAQVAATTLGATAVVNYGSTPAAVVVPAVNANIADWLNSTAPTVGSKTSANSIPVVVASDQGAVPVTLTSTTVTGEVQVLGDSGDNGSAATTDRVGTMPSIYQTSYLNGTAATQGRDAALSQGTDGLLWTAALPSMRPASYHASATFTGSSTTFAMHLAGNATNTVLVTKIMFSCTATTAGIPAAITVNKTSAASTGGTAATMTAVPDDSGFAAASSVAQSFTGTGPTVGTLVGQMDAYKLDCNAPGTAGPNDIYILNLRQKPIVLRGTAQTLEVGFGAAVTGGSYSGTFEWMETATITP